MPHRLFAAHLVIRVPVAGPQLPVEGERVAEQSDHRHHRPVRDRVLVVARGVGNGDAQLGGSAVVDGIKAHRRLLDEPAAPHALEHIAIDAVLVTAIGDHQVGVDAGRHDLGLRGRRRHERHLHLVAALEQCAHGGFVVRAEARDAGHSGSKASIPINELVRRARGGSLRDDDHRL